MADENIRDDENLTLADGDGAGAESTTVEVGADGAVMLPAGINFGNAEFAQSGSDVVVTAPDGTEVVIKGYFDQEAAPTLKTPGGSELSGDTATHLARVLSPTQEVAQAAPTADAQPIGQVESITDTVVAIRANGDRVELEAGNPVYQGDVLQSGEEGAIGIVLADETTFSMAENGRMVLDEMVYDPGTQEGSISMSVLQGVFIFVSGQVAKVDPDAMTLTTPVATIGIRGTQVGINLSPGEDGEPDLRVVLMEESDGFVGEVVISNAGGIQILNLPDQGSTVTGSNSAPAEPRVFQRSEIRESFADALDSLPTAVGTGNDYAPSEDETQEQEEQQENEEAAAEEQEGEEESATEESTEVGADEFAEAEGEDGDEASEGEDLEDFETAGGGEEEEAPPEEEGLDVGAGDFIDVTSDDVLNTGQGFNTGPVEDEEADDGGGGNERNEDTVVEALPDAEPPIVTLGLASGDEDTAIDMTISATVPAGSPGSIVGVTISNIPEGATISRGGEDLQLTDSGNGTRATTTETLDGTVDATVDPAVVTAVPASGDEDTAIDLDISTALADADGTVTSLSITDIPEGATLSFVDDSGATVDIVITDGGVTLSPDQLNGLQITPLQDDAHDFSLNITATSTDIDPDMVDNADAVAATDAATAAQTTEDEAIAASDAADLAVTEAQTAVDEATQALADANAATGEDAPSEADIALLETTLADAEVTLASATEVAADAETAEADAIAASVAADEVAADYAPSIAAVEAVADAEAAADALADADAALTDAKDAAADAQTAEDNAIAASDAADTALTDAKTAFNDAETALNEALDAPGGSGGTEAEIAELRATFEAAETTLTAATDAATAETDAIAASVTADAAVTSAETTLANAETLAETTAAADEAVIDAAEAAVEAEAVLATATSDAADAQAAENLATATSDAADAVVADAQTALDEATTALADANAAEGPDAPSEAEIAELEAAVADAETTLAAATEAAAAADVAEADAVAASDAADTVVAEATATVEAMTTGHATNTSETFAQTVEVIATVDAPEVAVKDASGAEDGGWIGLDFGANLVDNDGSETLSITISNVPEGAQLSAGTDLGGGNWAVAPEEISLLSINPAGDFSGDMNLSVSVTATEAGGDSATVDSEFTVTVTPTGDVSTPE